MENDKILVAHLRREAKRWRENGALGAIEDSAADLIDNLTATVARLEAENERLRKALEELISAVEHMPVHMDIMQRARAALARNGEKGNG